jgi:hypothetical protein
MAISSLRRSNPTRRLAPAALSLQHHCYKARLVAKGFPQRPGIDFDETSAPTTKWAALHAIFAIAALEDLELESIDISNAYLNGELKDVNVYMTQPEGFAEPGGEWVAKLIKGLYVVVSEHGTMNIGLWTCDVLL